MNQSDLGVPSQTREERGELSWVEKGKSNQLAAVRLKSGSLGSGYINEQNLSQSEKYGWELVATLQLFDKIMGTVKGEVTKGNDLKKNLIICIISLEIVAKMEKPSESGHLPELNSDVFLSIQLSAKDGYSFQKLSIIAWIKTVVIDKSVTNP